MVSSTAPRAAIPKGTPGYEGAVKAISNLLLLLRPLNLFINGPPFAQTFEASLIIWRITARFTPIYFHHVLTCGLTLAGSSRIGGGEAATPDGQPHKVASADTPGELPSW